MNIQLTDKQVAAFQAAAGADQTVFDYIGLLAESLASQQMETRMAKPENKELYKSFLSLPEKKLDKVRKLILKEVKASA